MDNNFHDTFVEPLFENSFNNCHPFSNESGYVLLMFPRFVHDCGIEMKKTLTNKMLLYVYLRRLFLACNCLKLWGYAF